MQYEREFRGPAPDDVYVNKSSAEQDVADEKTPVLIIEDETADATVDSVAEIDVVAEVDDPSSNDVADSGSAAEPAAETEEVVAVGGEEEDDSAAGNDGPVADDIEDEDAPENIGGVDESVPADDDTQDSDDDVKADTEVRLIPTRLLADRRALRQQFDRRDTFVYALFSVCNTIGSDCAGSGTCCCKRRYPRRSRHRRGGRVCGGCK